MFITIEDINGFNHEINPITICGILTEYDEESDNTLVYLSLANSMMIPLFVSDDEGEIDKFISYFKRNIETTYH